VRPLLIAALIIAALIVAVIILQPGLMARFIG
jgi:hypothetical protein